MTTIKLNLNCNNSFANNLTRKSDNKNQRGKLPTRALSQTSCLRG